MKPLRFLQILTCCFLSTTPVLADTWLEKPVTVGLHIDENEDLPRELKSIKENFYERLMIELRSYRHLNILGKNVMLAASEGITKRNVKSKQFIKQLALKSGAEFTILIQLEKGFRDSSVNINGSVYASSKQEQHQLNRSTVTIDDSSAGYMAGLAQEVHRTIRDFNREGEDTRTVLLLKNNETLNNHRLNQFADKLSSNYITALNEVISTESIEEHDHTLPEDFFFKAGFSAEELLAYQKKTLQQIHLAQDIDHIIVWSHKPAEGDGAAVNVQLLVYSGFLNEIRNAGTFQKGPLVVRGNSLEKESWSVCQLMIAAERTHLDRLLLLNAEYLAAEGMRLNERYIVKFEEEPVEEISENVERPGAQTLPSFEMGFTALGAGIYGSFDMAWMPGEQQSFALEISATYFPRPNFTYGSLMTGARLNWNFLFLTVGMAVINPFMEQGPETFLDNASYVPYANLGIQFFIWDSLYFKAYGAGLYNEEIVPWGGAGFGIAF